ncbi:restriction endonuclease subunit S [Halorhodospira halochloris]|uniref:restriction endonuclease subunit S n=1 Tax=Halorhodospira halochloris TaxID=1052 RepID=UPI001EE8C36B|nr:restriction endonuclease subunit S [Halorhodospira halochloris]MCG5531281.1 restriction endonuclease subunit S [Halorhodospira halochloris]
MSFPAYPEYKDSGVEWLGEVPTHWEVKRLSHYFKERREKASDAEFAPLSVTMHGVVPRLENAAKTKDGDNRKKVLPGDFVINSRSDRKGSSGISPTSGTVSLICIVLEPQCVVRRFVHHLLRSVPFQEEFYKHGKGIVADLWSTGFADMKNIMLAMPPSEEQQAIANFLDHETARIDALIEEQQRLIELLKEKRQAVISHAVTKGLDPDVPMKDSGVEWLGEVPEHWDVAKFKYAIAEFEQGWSPQCDSKPVNSAAEWGVLKVGCVNQGAFDPTENKRLPDSLEARPDLAVRKDDLLISRANTRELVGSAAQVPEDHPNLMASDKLFVLRLAQGVCNTRYAAAYLGDRRVRHQIELEATGASSSMLNIGQAAIRELWMPLPPKEEQDRIIEDLDNKNTVFTTLERETALNIQLLNERRSALISAAVTGKIDVRGWTPPASSTEAEHEGEGAVT